MILKSFSTPARHPDYFASEDTKVILVTWSSELTTNNISRCTLREDMWPWKIHSNKNPNKQNWPIQHLKITPRLENWHRDWINTPAGVDLSSFHRGMCVPRARLPLVAGLSRWLTQLGPVRTTLEEEGQLRSLSAYSSLGVTSGSVCSSSRQ